MPNPTPEALVACPFCGGDAAVNTTRTTDPEFIRLNKRDTGYGVNCVVCGANNKGSSIGYRTRELAVSAWNKRAALASGEPAVQPKAAPGAVDYVELAKAVRAEFAKLHATMERINALASRPVAALSQSQSAQAGGGEVVGEKEKVFALSSWLHEERPEAERALWAGDLVRIVRLIYTAPPASPAAAAVPEYHWQDGEPPKWFDESFIAVLDNGERVVLRRLPEEWTYDYTTADETYYKASRVRRWMQFPDSQFVPLAAAQKDGA